MTRTSRVASPAPGRFRAKVGQQPSLLRLPLQPPLRLSCRSPLSYPSPLDLVSSGTYSAYIYDTTASGGQDLGDWFADGNDVDPLDKRFDISINL